MPATRQEREILRELARQVAEIAALPVQQKTVAAWQAINRLEPVRPMFMIDQMPWHELDADGELTLRTTDEFCRRLETQLRRTLYMWNHLRTDQVIRPWIEVPKAIEGFMDFGIKTREEQAVADPSNDVVGHFYLDQIPTEGDIEKIRTPNIRLNAAATAKAEAEANEIFDGLLAVRMVGITTFFQPWDVIVMWHGGENTVLDVIDRPQFMHAMIARLTDAYLAMLDQLEAQGLLQCRQEMIHCSGADTTELPAAGFDPARPRAKDVWTCGMAQIFSTVSPAMHQEFDLDYAVRWYERFGLVYYGCCEPLHDKIDIIRKIPHLRKISMSPWVNVPQGAERIGGDFVFSRKPSPALLAGDTFDLAAVRQDLQATLHACQRHACPLEFILKDISTVRYQPQRLWQWAQTARELVGQ